MPERPTAPQHTPGPSGLVRMGPECKNLPYSVRIVTTWKKIGKLPSSSYLSREENSRFRETFREAFLYEKASRNPIIDKNYKPDGWEREMRTMNFWCRKCLSCVDVRDAEWRVNIVGKPSAGGPCANCGSPVLHRITKMSEAPPDIGGGGQGGQPDLPALAEGPYSAQGRAAAGAGNPVRPRPATNRQAGLRVRVAPQQGAVDLGTGLAAHPRIA